MVLPVNPSVETFWIIDSFLKVHSVMIGCELGGKAFGSGKSFSRKAALFFEMSREVVWFGVHQSLALVRMLLETWLVD